MDGMIHMRDSLGTVISSPSGHLGWARAPYDPLVTQKCLSRATQMGELEYMFHGQDIYGSGTVWAHEPYKMRLHEAFGILRAVLTIRVNVEHLHVQKARMGADFDAEAESAACADDIEATACPPNDWGFCLQRLWRSDEAPDEGSRPGYRCVIWATPQYWNWLKPRVDLNRRVKAARTRKADGRFAERVDLRVTDDGPELIADVLVRDAGQGDEMSGQMRVDVLERLADLIAEIHLCGYAPVVRDGSVVTDGSDDVLAALWRTCYGTVPGPKVLIRRCEVCHQAFATGSVRARGHAECLNRRRVQRSRAKRFARKVESGTDPAEAAAQCSISVETALAELGGLGYAFKGGVAYGGPAR